MTEFEESYEDCLTLYSQGQSPAEPEVPGREVRHGKSVAWVSTDVTGWGCFNHVSPIWDLQPFSVTAEGPSPDLNASPVAVIELDVPLTRVLVELVSHWPTIKWVALVRPESLKDDQLRSLIHDYCYDFHTLPLDYRRLDITIGHALGMAELEADCGLPEQELLQVGDVALIGASVPMSEMLHRLKRAAPSGASVLIQGESGTGKELVANALHRNSPRVNGPFMAINCGALPPQLIQSELFGHEAGAFTGAGKRKLGQLELAHNGTLLLDEIADLDLELQVNLLRFLQEGTLWRVGGVSPVQIDVRIVAATHVDLAAAVASGQFREDLYYRLNVIQIDVPSLRERGAGDLLRLARFYLEHFRPRRPQLRGFSRNAIETMCRHGWPGNVRELINRIERAVAMAEGRLIQAEDLGFQESRKCDPPRSLAVVRDQAERESIEQALHRTAYNVSKAARELQVGRVTLYRLMRKHGIDFGDRA